MKKAMQGVVAAVVIMAVVLIFVGVRFLMYKNKDDSINNDVLNYIDSSESGTSTVVESTTEIEVTDNVTVEDEGSYTYAPISREDIKNLLPSDDIEMDELVRDILNSHVELQEFCMPVVKSRDSVGSYSVIQLESSMYTSVFLLLDESSSYTGMYCIDENVFTAESIEYFMLNSIAGDVSEIEYLE